MDKFKCLNCGNNGNRLEPYQNYESDSSEIYLDDNGFKKGGGNLLYKCPECGRIICIDVEFNCKITKFIVTDVTNTLKHC